MSDVAFALWQTNNTKVSAALSRPDRVAKAPAAPSPRHQNAAKSDPSKLPPYADLAELLAEVGLKPLAPLLGDRSLAGLAAHYGEDRAAFLANLKDKGVEPLASRQQLANALGKVRWSARWSVVSLVFVRACKCVCVCV